MIVERLENKKNIVLGQRSSQLEFINLCNPWNRISKGVCCEKGNIECKASIKERIVEK